MATSSSPGASHGRLWSGIFAHRFDSAGVGWAQFQVNTYTPSIQNRSSVAMESNGDFVVVWESYHRAGPTGYGVFGQRFTSAGAHSAPSSR